MAEVVKLPKWGLTMEEAEIVEWLVGVGGRVEKGETLATVASEKVEIELPAPVGGVVAEHLVGTGETVPVGADLAVIVADDEELAAYRAGHA
jgi:pyruvate/2-oxoglutarate dehydrogenase complex dihydrolipoamide acyltransferase (E2) component